jgi:propanol-preferring alcohol dehydrogenase
VYAFTKDGDTKTQNFAKELGAVWAGGTSDNPDALMDASIIFAPAGNLVPIALKGVDKGGVVVCAGIHMSDIPSFPYSILWEERILRSVANLTRKDGEEFLNLAVEVPVKTFDRQYSLEDVNEALEDLRNGRLEGSAVIKL